MKSVGNIKQKRKWLKSFIKKFRSHGETRIADILQQMLTVELGTHNGNNNIR